MRKLHRKPVKLQSLEDFVEHEETRMANVDARDVPKTVQIRWTKDTRGLDLEPIWTVQSVRVESVWGYLANNGIRHDLLAIVITLTPEQIKTLVKKYGSRSMKDVSDAGSLVIPLVHFDQIMWIWFPKDGQEGVREGVYKGFEIV